jgi:hypothetical protein
MAGAGRYRRTNAAKTVEKKYALNLFPRMVVVNKKCGDKKLLIAA